MQYLRYLLLSVLVVLVTQVYAGDVQTQIPPQLSQAAAIEPRLKAISAELRCLVCQNQSLADSHAELAEDLRREIRIQIAAGKSDDDIRTFLVTRYGEFVLYRPRFEATTWLLWLGPFALLVTGVFVALNFLRRKQNSEGNTA